MRAPNSLFARTALTLAAALLLFILFTGIVTFRYILLPVGQQAADDLAALIVLSAQTWVELPPQIRPEFVAELEQGHRLRLRDTPPPGSLEPLAYHSPYMRFLEEALGRRLGQPTHLHQVPEEEPWYWAPVPAGDRILYLGFSHDRVGARPPRALLWIFAGAGIFILITTLLVVRRINRPLTRLGQGVQRLGQSGLLEPLEESGPTELALLARKFNELGGEVQRLLENRTTLLGGISHDLRTPLARLGIALELLEAHSDPELLAQMRRDLEEMNDIVTRTLELAGAMQADDGAMERRPLQHLVETVAEEYRRQGEALVVELPSSCSVEVPALPMRRILGNLLDNALHYGNGKEVVLRLECGKAKARVCVIDRGPGIPEAELERVFQPFHRLEPSRSTATGGSGLGLAIVRQLAAIQGWEVKLENRHEGGLAACVQVESLQGQGHPHPQPAQRG